MGQAVMVTTNLRRLHLANGSRGTIQALDRRGLSVYPLDLASSCVPGEIPDRTNDTPTLEAGAIVYVLCGQTVV